MWLGSEYQLVHLDTPSNFEEGMSKWIEGTIGFNVEYYIISFHESISPNPVIVTSFALSMVVNTLVTGLIVFKILKVFLEVKRTPGLGPTGVTTLGPIIFIIIESGMALFAVQLVRVVYSCVPWQFPSYLTFNIITGINQMFNVIIRFIHFYVFVFLINFTWLGHRSNNNFGAGLNEIVHG